jgi:single-stranded-DNA-specific exonuclease
MGNPAPLFLTRGVEVRNARTMGATAAHFRLDLLSNGTTWNAVAFKQSWISGTTHVDIVYTIDIDYWNGNPRIRLTIKDYSPTKQPRLAL